MKEFRQKGDSLLRRFYLSLLIILLFSLPGGTELKAPSGRWRVLINIPARTMQVFEDAGLWREFTVAVGKPSTPTPTGEFFIARKIKDPTWYPEGKDPVPPGPDNPLGRYWLGLNLPGYGIHGNNNPFSIGYWVSSGCIRVKNQEIELLYQLLPVGTPVKIVYEPVLLKKKDNQVWLELYADIYGKIPDMKELVRQAVKKQFPHFKMHDEALWRVIGDNRPVLLEIPEALEISVDGEIYAYKAYRYNGKIYLPCEITKLWEEKPLQNPPEFLEYLMKNPGKVYGFWDEQSETVILHTIRLVFRGKSLPVRGWVRDEPCLNGRQLSSLIKKDKLLGGKLSPAFQPDKENLLFTEGDAWIPLSKLREIWPRLNFLWNENTWEIQLEETGG